MFAFDNLGGKGFSACFTAVELHSLKFFLAPAALDHFPALAIRATISSGVCWLVAVLPKQVEVAVFIYLFESGFCRHRAGV
jgi:hypothetical protein